MAETFAKDTLRKLVTSHFEMNGSELRFSKVQTGHFNTTYFVEGSERPLVIRIAPPDDAGFVFYERGMMAQEPGIHRLVREMTSVPVAEIIAYDTSRALVERDYLLMERLPGVPLTNFNPSREQFDKVLEQVGRCLRQIHEISAEKYGYLGEHACMEPQASWAEAFRVMWGKLVDDIVGAGYYDAEEEVRAKRLLDQHLAHLDRPVTSRLLHMDIWSQNILVDTEANVTGVVDFDRALWGDKEIEFAVLDYCGISEPAFWQGYGRRRSSDFAARIRRMFYLIYEVQKYIVIYHHRNSDPGTALRYKRQVMGMFEQF